MGSVLYEIFKVLFMHEIPSAFRQWIVLGIRVFALQIEMVIAVNRIM